MCLNVRLFSLFALDTEFGNDVDDEETMMMIIIKLTFNYFIHRIHISYGRDQIFFVGSGFV